jgi:hypothetical protein
MHRQCGWSTLVVDETYEQLLRVRQPASQPASSCR